MTHPQLSPQDTFSIREDLVVEHIDDEFLVLDLRGNEYFGLNPVARHIWAALQEGQSLQQVERSVCDHFEVDAPVAAHDTAEFVQALLQANLLMRTGSDAG